MKIRLLKPYNGTPAGTIRDWEPNVCDVLILRRIAEAVVETKAIETAPLNKSFAPASNKHWGRRAQGR